MHPSESTLTGSPPRCSSAKPSSSTCSTSPVGDPALRAGVSTSIPQPMMALMSSLRGVAATIGDKILTPLRWNALVGHALRSFPFQASGRAERTGPLPLRHRVHRISRTRSAKSSSCAPSKCFGSTIRNRDRVRSPMRCMKDQEHPAFQWAWNRRVVASQLSDESLMFRNHALVGKIAVYAVDFVTPMRPNLLVRTLVPGDKETAAKIRPFGGSRNGAPASEARRRRAAGSHEGIAGVRGTDRT